MKRILAIIFALIMVITLLGACAQQPAQAPAPAPAPAPTPAPAPAPAPEPEEEQFIIGFSNAGVGNSWAAAYFNATVNALGQLPNVTFFAVDANDSATKQIADVEDLLAKNIDLLMIRPENPEALSAVVEKAYATGIPVVITGRSIATDKYTSFVQLDDTEVGRMAAKHAVKLLEEEFGEARGRVIELQGNMGAGSAQRRHAGKIEIFAQYPGIELIAQQPAMYRRADGKTVMENLLMAHRDIDLIISAGGEQLIGAMEAIDAAGRTGEAHLVAIDGYNGVLKGIKAGTISYTVLYPVALGAETVMVAMKILEGEDVPKIWSMPLIEVTSENVDDYVNMDAPDTTWTY